MRTIAAVAETMVPSIDIARTKREAAVLNMAAYRPDFHDWIFLVSMGKTQLGGFIKPSSFSITKEPRPTRRCYWHPFTCRMTPWSGINGMNNPNQTYNGRSSLKPCVSVSVLQTMKISTRLSLNCSKRAPYENTKHSLTVWPLVSVNGLSERWLATTSAD